MHVVVLGGAGDMGSRAVEALALAPDVARVTIADRAVDRAHTVVSRLGHVRAAVDVAPVDADDHGSLVRVMRGARVVASALGPFDRYETRLAAAALDAGVDYASLCDEWQAADELHTRFDARARAAGRVVLSGLGASPGLTSVAIRHLADQMDKPRRAEVFLYQPLDGGGGEAAHRERIHSMTRPVAGWRAGRRCVSAACAERRRVEFPRFGSIELYNVGHSEAVTLPRSIPGLEEVGFWRGHGRGTRLVVQPARWGLLGGARREALATRLWRGVDRLGVARPAGLSALRIDVHGEKDGRPQHRFLCGIGLMRESTGQSLAIGALMVARRELRTTGGGVYSPEACIPPMPFIRAMRAAGIETYHDLAMTRVVA